MEKLDCSVLPRSCREQNPFQNYLAPKLENYSLLSSVLNKETCKLKPGFWVIFLYMTLNNLFWSRVKNSGSIYLKYLHKTERGGIPERGESWVQGQPVQQDKTSPQKIIINK